MDRRTLAERRTDEARDRLMWSALAAVWLLPITIALVAKAF